MSVPFEYCVMQVEFLLARGRSLNQRSPTECVYVGVRVCASQAKLFLTHCGRVTQICVFNTVKLGTSASSP